MTRLIGQATEASTKNYADRMWQNNPKISPDTWRIFEGLTVSKIGFGAYRTIGTDSQKDALVKALKGGINLIDTSSNYMDGDSERFIGETITELHKKDVIKREEIVLVTKGGYLQGENLIEAQTSNIQEVVKINDLLWHSIHPSNLERQLERSLERLNVETIDCYLLHNPEYFIAHAVFQMDGEMTKDIENLYYSRIENAFEFLENCVKEGKIGCYGVSSNTFAVPKEQADHTDLAKVFECAQKAAQKAWGRKKRPAFRCIEMPFNLLELGPIKEVNTTAHIIDGTEEVPTLELASRMNLSVLANRPLNAFPHNGGIYRLSEGFNKEEADVRSVEDCLEDLKGTESALNKVLNGWPSVNEQSMFSFTAHSDELLEQMDNSIQLDHMDSVFLTPHIGMMNHVLSELKEGKPELGDALDLIAENFTLQAQAFIAALRKNIREKDAEKIKIFDIETRDRLPEEWKDAPFQQIALNTIASVPGVTCTLSGMRRTSYVEDALATFERGDFKDVAQIIGTHDDIPEEMVFGDMDESA